MKLTTTPEIGHVKEMLEECQVAVTVNVANGWEEPRQYDIMGCVGTELFKAVVKPDHSNGSNRITLATETSKPNYQDNIHTTTVELWFQLEIEQGRIHTYVAPVKKLKSYALNVVPIFTRGSFKVFDKKDLLDHMTIINSTNATKILSEML